MAHQSIDQIQPETLLRRVRSKPLLGAPLLMSILLHTAVIGLTSLPFLYEVYTHGSWDIREAKETELQEIEDQRQEALALERERRRQELKEAEAAKPKSPEQPNQPDNSRNRPNREVIFEEPDPGLSDIDIDSEFLN